MSPKRKQEKTTEPARVSSEVETTEGPAATPDREAKIRSRAYDLYLQRGQESGSELEDWLQAERELEGGLLY